MNKIILTLILIFSGYLSLPAQTSSASLQAIRQEVSKFLTSYGYSPAVETSTQKISYKKEGTDYWLTINEERPFSVELHRADISLTDVRSEQVIKSCNYANNHVMGAKVYWKDGRVILSARYYVNGIDDFKKMFYKYMNQLNLLETTFKKSYNDYK